MLHVYHSNRLEVLFALLRAQLAERPLADPILPEQILVPNPGIGRWLSLQLADADGIAANIDYPLPASYVWRLYREQLDRVPEQSGFAKPRLLWRLLALLDEGGAGAVMPALQRYLAAADPAERARKRVQLASNIADVFDQYLVYRPDWLADWERGGHAGADEDHWQPPLWRALNAAIGEPHRATLQRALIGRAAAGELRGELLPARLSVFNAVALPPGVLDVLCAVAAHTDLTLYLLNPSTAFWDDIVSRRQQQLDLMLHGEEAPAPSGNALLALCGKLGQTALRLLHQREGLICEQDFSLAHPRGDRLGLLQAEIQSLEQGLSGEAGPTQDRSIDVHSCHSPLREVQVLHDQLQDRFGRLEGLGPHEVVVMVPDIDTYAPLVEAVFGAAPAERFIPFAVADQSLAASDPLFEALRGLLALPDSDFAASQVLDWLALPALARRFALDAPEAQRQIAAVVHEGRARRLSGRAPLAADAAAPLHSWAFALRRQLAAWVLGEGETELGPIVAGAAPDGQGAAALGRALDALEALLHWQGALAAPRPMAEWLSAFNAMAESLFDPDDDESASIGELRALLRALAENAAASGFDAALPREAMLGLLDEALQGAGGRAQRFLTGRLTVSSLVPLRSVPFRVVCLLGLNDGDFPRQRRPLSVDLMARTPRLGDRSIRDDDQYLFLEAVLSARDALYLSYVGQDPQDNSERAPSVLLAELLDYHARAGREIAVIKHPLQAFSPRAFDPQLPALQSFAAEWLGEAKDSPAPPAGAPLAPAAVSIDALSRFWRDPAGWYCRERLHVALALDARLPPDHEPFALDALERYQLRDTLLADGDGQGRLLERLRGQGLLPHGAFAELALQGPVEAVEALRALRLGSGFAALPAREIEIPLGQGWQIGGVLDGLAESTRGRALVIASAGKSTPGRRLQAGLRHLIACAGGWVDIDAYLYFIDARKAQTLPWLAVEPARRALRDWVEGYALAHASALPFFPDCSTALASDGFSPAVWIGDDNRPGEGRAEAVQLLWPGVEDPRQIDGFSAWAERIVGPLLSREAH